MRSSNRSPVTHLGSLAPAIAFPSVPIRACRAERVELRVELRVVSWRPKSSEFGDERLAQHRHASTMEDGAGFDDRRLRWMVTIHRGRWRRTGLSQRDSRGASALSKRSECGAFPVSACMMDSIASTDTTPPSLGPDRCAQRRTTLLPFGFMKLVTLKKRTIYAYTSYS